MMTKIVVSTVLPSASGGASHNVFYNYIRSNGDSVLVLFSHNNIDISFLSELNNIINVIVVTKRSKLKGTLNRVVNDYNAAEIFYFDYPALYISNFFPTNIHKKLWIGDTRFEVAYFNALEALNQKKINQAFLYLAKAILDLVKIKYYALKLDEIICCSLYTYERLSRLHIKSFLDDFKYNEVNLHPIEWSDSRNVIFFGNLKGLGSRSGLDNLTTILDKYSKELLTDKIRITLFGRTTLDEDFDSITKNPIVNYRGYVNNLNDLFSSSICAIVPISVPVGNRTRVISCLQAGLPVLLFRQAAFGNKYLVDGYNCIFVDNDNFFSKLNKLINDKDYWNTISKNSSSTYNKYFRPL